MSTLSFVEDVIRPFLKDNFLVEPEVTDLRDFVAVSCWTIKQLNEIHAAMLAAPTGALRQYATVSHQSLESHLLLVAKGFGRDYTK